MGLREGEELLFCSSRDVTERRAQARELERYRDHLETLVAERTEQWRASEVRFRALAEQSLVGVYVQLNNEYRFVNDAFAAIFGYARAQDMLDGRVRAHTLIAPEDLDHVNEVSRRVISGEAPMTRLEFTGVRRDGSRIALETFASPIHDAEGPSAIGLLLDVTVQHQAEAERAAALLREQGLRAGAEEQARSLRELLEQREEFLRVLAHEVRQPLNNASAALQSALSGLPAEDGAAERVTRAQAVIRQIVDSLDNTLAATALLASAQGLDPRDADVGALIPGRSVTDTVLANLRFAGGARGQYTITQAAAGSENDIRLRVYGERGHLDWSHRQSAYLHLNIEGEPARTVGRGDPGLPADIARLSRTPRGHPEGLLEAFANLYREAAEAIHARNAGAPLAQVSFPTIDDGVESMRFIEACIASHAAGGRWIGT